MLEAVYAELEVNLHRGADTAQTNLAFEQGLVKALYGPAAAMMYDFAVNPQPRKTR